MQQTQCSDSDTSLLLILRLISVPLTIIKNNCFFPLFHTYFSFYSTFGILVLSLIDLRVRLVPIMSLGRDMSLRILVVILLKPCDVLSLARNSGSLETEEKVSIAVGVLFLLVISIVVLFM